MDTEKVGVVKQGAPASGGVEITPLVIADLKARSAVGKERYGRTLNAFNGRDMLVDAYQEALDLCVYLRGELEERGESPDADLAGRDFDPERDGLVPVSGEHNRQTCTCHPDGGG